MSGKRAAESVEIVLAEDNPADVYMIRRALETTGLRFQLTVVEDGAEALQLVRQACAAASSRPDLILLDLNLPKSEGKDILAAIRQSEHGVSVPVAMLSSSISPVDRRKIEQLGADGYLEKPAGLDDFFKLGAALKELLMTNRRLEASER